MTKVATFIRNRRNRREKEKLWLDDHAKQDLFAVAKTRGRERKERSITLESIREEMKTPDQA